MYTVHEGQSKQNIATTATTTTVIQDAKTFLGVFVSQASSTPTLQVRDGNGNIFNTFTPAAGTLYALPCIVQGVLAVTTGGTMDCTVAYGVM